MSPDADMGCALNELQEGQDYNLTDRADTLLVVASGRRSLQFDEEGVVEPTEVHGVARCSRPSVVATDYSVVDFVPYVYWMTENEYRNLLYTLAPDRTDSDIEARLQAYRELVNTGIASPGETLTGIADNANAAAGVAGLYAAAKRFYPNLTGHEILAAFIVSADHERMTLNGEDLRAVNNGAGLGYNKPHGGFGMVTSQNFFEELNDMALFKQENAGQITTPKRVSVDGGEFVQLVENQEAIYPMIVQDEITAYRLMLDIELEESVEEGIISSLQIVSPTGARYDFIPSVHGNRMSVSTDEIFALQGQGYWWLRMGQGLRPVDSTVRFTLSGVETGGFVDQQMETKNIGDDSILGVGRTLDPATALQRVLALLGGVVDIIAELK